MNSQKKVWSSIAEEWDRFKSEKPAEHVQNFLKNSTGNILDLGSGSGRHLSKIKNGKMHLVDFSEKMIEFAKKKAEKEKINAEFYVSGMTSLPFKENFFDGAIVIASLHCIKGEKNRKKAISEIFRVLKPKAEAEIAVWNKNSKRFIKSKKEKYIKWRDKGKRYYYLFGEDEIHRLFKEAGFKIKKVLNSERNIIFIAEKPQNLAKRSG